MIEKAYKKGEDSDDSVSGISQGYVLRIAALRDDQLNQESQYVRSGVVNGYRGVNLGLNAFTYGSKAWRWTVF